VKAASAANGYSAGRPAEIVAVTDLAHSGGHPDHCGLERKGAFASHPVLQVVDCEALDSVALDSVALEWGFVAVVKGCAALDSGALDSGCGALVYDFGALGATGCGVYQRHPSSYRDLLAKTPSRNASQKAWPGLST
jgi:hypothetical protein